MSQRIKRLSRFGLLVAVSSTVLLRASVGNAALSYTGVNLAGAEFGTAGGALPGTFGSQYTYPTSTEVNYFVGKGMNTFRLPFRWERLQQSQNAAFNSNELSRMNSFVNTATTAGAYVVVDPHNFARYYPDLTDFNSMQSGSTGLIGSASVPISSFTDFWTRMANQYKNNSHVVFNLMNEPNAINTQTWVNAANAAIVGIRSTGATNLILVPGVNWTGASSWDSSNGTAMLNIVDSGNNFAFDMHLYLDDGSGSHDWITNDDPTIGVSRIAGATQWLKTNHRRGFLGEFAVSNASIGGGTFSSTTDPGTTHAQIGDEATNNLFNNMEANSDAWLGWTWWAGGPWWTSYMFSPEPTNLGAPTPTDKPLMAVIQPHFAHPVTGDYDGNGLVNVDDYTVWQNSFGQTGAGLGADGNHDGIVNAADFTIWRDHATLGGGGAFAQGSVPEPSTAFLLVAACGVMGVARRYRG